MVVAFVAVVWGVTFTVAENTTAQLPPTDLVAWRFGLGAVVLMVFQRSAGRLPTLLRRRAIILGGLLGVGFLLQTWALTVVGAMMSGFYTGLVVVLAPLLGWMMFRERMGRAGIVAIGTATAGIAVIGFRESGLGPGEVLSLLAAATWALHMVLLSRWSDSRHAIRFGCIQLAVVAAMAQLVIVMDAGVTGRSVLPTLPSDGGTWISVVFLAVLASAVAMVLLSWAQPRISVGRAAVILTLEPVVAALTDIMTGARPSPRTVLGAALLFVAMYTVNAYGRTISSGRTDKRGRHAAPPSSWSTRRRTRPHSM